MTFFSVFTEFAGRRRSGAVRALAVPDRVALWGRLTTPRAARVRASLVSVFAAATLTFTGCGPSLYGMEISTAARVVAQAKQARGAELAPYEFHYAALNLEKAREEAAEASYEDAVRFARVARKYGKIARDQALAHLEAQSRAPMMVDERREAENAPANAAEAP